MIKFICRVFLDCRRGLKSWAFILFKICKTIATFLLFSLSFFPLLFFFLNSLIFGAITCFTGFLGVITGAGATKWCRSKTQRADPLVCAVGMLGSAIFICLIFVAAKSSIVGAYVSAILSLCQPHQTPADCVHCALQKAWGVFLPLPCWTSFFLPLGILALSKCAWSLNCLSLLPWEFRAPWKPTAFGLFYLHLNPHLHCSCLMFW